MHYIPIHKNHHDTLFGRNIQSYENYLLVGQRNDSRDVELGKWDGVLGQNNEGENSIWKQERHLFKTN